MNPPSTQTATPNESPRSSYRKQQLRPGSSLALSPAEERVMELLTDGLTNQEIATKLFVSKETVKTQVKTILIKLDARNRANAIAIYLRRGYGL